MEEQVEQPEEDDGRIGIFPNWNALYATVVVYTLAVIVLLYAFTILLDHSSP